MKRTPFKRKDKKSGVKIGKHTGKVRLTGAKLTELREAVYDRAQGRCELRLKGCEWFAGWIHGQMHHKVHRSLGGSDSMENCIWVCARCHMREHNQ